MNALRKPPGRSSKKAPLILEALKGADMNSTKIAEQIHASRNTVDYNLAVLHEKEQVHIARYIKGPGGLKFYSKIWRFGPGEDAVHPDEPWSTETAAKAFRLMIADLRRLAPDPIDHMVATLCCLTR